MIGRIKIPSERNVTFHKSRVLHLSVLIPRLHCSFDFLLNYSQKTKEQIQRDYLFWSPDPQESCIQPYSFIFIRILFSYRYFWKLSVFSQFPWNSLRRNTIIRSIRYQRGKYKPTILSQNKIYVQSVKAAIFFLCSSPGMRCKKEKKKRGGGKYQEESILKKWKI